MPCQAPDEAAARSIGNRREVPSSIGPQRVRLTSPFGGPDGFDVPAKGPEAVRPALGERRHRRGGVRGDAVPRADDPVARLRGWLEIVAVLCVSRLVLR